MISAANTAKDLYSSILSGDFTYYGTGGLTSGHCTLAPMPSWFTSNFNFAVAVSTVTYSSGDSSGGCGMCLRGKYKNTGSGLNPPPNEFLAYVVDECPSCPQAGDVDAAVAGDGRWQVEWTAVDCPVGGAKVQYVFQGSNTYYLKLQVRGHRVALAGVEVQTTSKSGWIAGTRTSDNFFTFFDAPFPAVFPLPVRITAVTGQVLTDSITNLTNDVQLAGTVQFDPIAPTLSKSQRSKSRRSRSRRSKSRRSKSRRSKSRRSKSRRSKSKSRQSRSRSRSRSRGPCTRPVTTASTNYSVPSCALSLIPNGGTCTPVCRPGYMATGSLSRVCNQGNLAGSVGSCVTTSCTRPANTLSTNYSVPSCSSSIPSGGVCTPKCRTGYTNFTRLDQLCVNGSLSTPGLCTPNNCTRPASTTAINYLSCRTPILSGTTCTPLCKSDHYAAVSLAQSCTAGVLSKPVGFGCFTTNCTRPANTASTIYSSKCPASMRNGTTCVPECASGYTALGDVTLICHIGKAFDRGLCFNSSKLCGL